MLTSDFGSKLDLVLKRLSMSRGRLAAELGVDKSVVGRWVSGTITPSAHNVAALTGFVATRCSGFTMLDWDRDLASFTEVLGIDPAAVRLDRHRGDLETNFGSYPRGLIEIARRETQRRGGSYEGFYEATFPSTTRLGSFVKWIALIQRRDGLLYARMGGMGIELNGWLFLVTNQLYGVLGDLPDDSLAFLLLNGLPTAHVETMDGLFMSNSGDVSLAPLVSPIYFKFLDKLLEDDRANEAHFSTLKAGSRFVEPAELGDELRRHLLPETGPAAAAAGTGDILMRLPSSRSLSRGTDTRPVSVADSESKRC